MSAFTIDVTRGEIEYVNIIVTENTGKDISGITYQVAIATAGDRAPATGWVTPSTNVQGGTTAQRVLTYLVNSSTPLGTYYLFSRIPDGPETAIRRRPSAFTVI